ncbi:STAS domain-containing protein [Thiohalomonas denitrificans]|uniref:Phospholipid transport system transporter-binding protein n=1 Tax=Thiohalomonas denitrificans TaxID=415747 RepID=A0A1G5PMX8_9GAMM|nr:STAS domain-containing protein [Thiohalomonas denitrificans]SCZ50561.1 phospholipid transport system transporter-binding protein [Thiohalomonas denitrificans]
MMTGRFKVDDGSCRVEGELTFETVTDVLKQSDSVFKTGSGALVIDLSGVTRSDSAGVTLLMEWLRRARQADLELHFQQIPEQMRAIARTSGMEPLLQ